MRGNGGSARGQYLGSGRLAAGDSACARPRRAKESRTVPLPAGTELSWIVVAREARWVALPVGHRLVRGSR